MSLIAREVEAAGIPTIAMSVGRDITAQVRPPRAAYLHYPMGNTAGPPGKPELQEAIVKAALEQGALIEVPGSIVDLPFATDAEAPDGGPWEEWVYTKAFRRQLMKTREGDKPKD